MSEPKLRCPKCGAHNAYGGDAESYPCSRCGFDGRMGTITENCPNCGGTGKAWHMQGGPHGIGRMGKCWVCS